MDLFWNMCNQRQNRKHLPILTLFLLIFDKGILIKVMYIPPKSVMEKW